MQSREAGKQGNQGFPCDPFLCGKPWFPAIISQNKIYKWKIKRI
jgi:hypothetical protein